MKIEDLLLRLQPVKTWGNALESIGHIPSEQELLFVGNISGEDVLGFTTSEGLLYYLYQDELNLFLPYHLAKSLTQW